ncbi:UdgX family uracil-DNA binding protein [Maricaulis sp. CAU 1757]
MSVASAQLAGPADFHGWRVAARDFCGRGLAPERVRFEVPGEAPGLFAGPGGAVNSQAGGSDAEARRPVSAPKRFVEMARRAAAHRDPERFARLYRLLWRLQDQPRLLDDASDTDVGWLMACEKAVRRDIHKMHAFVRFRAAGEGPGGRERFAAWFEPEHYIVELATPFFMRRFPNMDWLIVTPEASAAWDGEQLRFGPGGTRADVPAEDGLEAAWNTYFASIFNPARLKTQAMTSEMPKKYWKNLPEAAQIPDLIAAAEARQRTMREHGVSEANPRAAGWVARARRDAAAPTDPLEQARAAVQSCRECPLAGPATQAVFGEGPGTARLMLVGEQPGDREDLAGKVFVGPAGAVLDKALGQAGLDRAALYLTNAVKHFKFLARGKTRLHARPSAREIDTCSAWLAAERAEVQPEVIVALGASAARGVLGQAVKLADVRGMVLNHEGARVIVTVHPAHVLRSEGAVRAEAFDRLVADLARAKALIASEQV